MPEPAPEPAPDTGQLVAAAAAGDPDARDRLLARHRPRLRRMVAVRLDPRLAPRVDPSDVVQDALTEAARRLDAYLAAPPLPFYPWLRQLAAERVVDAHRRHHAGRRAVRREEPPGLPDGSVQELAARLTADDPGPSAQARRAEDRARVLAALDRLPDADREVLVLRHLEDLSTAEAAAALGVSEGAVKMRLLRALRKLQDLVTEGGAP